MKTTSIALGTLAYTLVTFPLAVAWHIVLFRPFYESIGYFGSDPSFVLGFVSILIQGVLLSAGFGMVRLDGGRLRRGLLYAGFLGLFFWTSHVAAFAAKHPLARTPDFFVFETLYLGLQFGIFGLLIGRIYPPQKAS